MESGYAAMIRDFSDKWIVRIWLDLREDRREGVESVDVIGGIRGGCKGVARLL